MWLFIISLLRTKIVSEEEILDNLYLSNPPLAFKYLKQFYIENDIDCIEDKKIESIMIETKWGYKKGYRIKFFNQFLEKHGVLFCQVCSTSNLNPKYDNKACPSTLATIEHFIPLSEGGLKYSWSNWLCTCSKCNNERGSMPLYKQPNSELYYYK